MLPLQATEILSDFVSSCESGKSLPLSMQEFARDRGHTLSQLKDLYPSLISLEQAVYAHFFEQTQKLMNNDPAYADYGLQERILALYYTLFELFAANQNYVMLSLGSGVGLLQHLAKLKDFKKAFIRHLNFLLSPLLPNSLPKALKQIQLQALSEAVWLQFLSILGFWLHDRSTSHERTDILIEKTVAASLEIWSALNWRSTPDLLRFWVEEFSPEKRLK